MLNEPLVSIGLPVYNGENFLSQALDSILDQTFENFELIIADNASTDATEEICKAYAEKDNRIRYYRHEQNLGAAKNYNFVFEVSNSKYFRWAAHDDLIAPEFLEKCIEVLEQDSSIVLCCSKTAKIDENSVVIGNYDRWTMRVDSEKVHVRFHDLICVWHPCTMVFGVIRSDILQTTPLIDNYINSDKNLLAELSLSGRFREIPEHLFLRREHPHTSTNLFPDSVQRAKWFDPEITEQNTFPFKRMLHEYLRAIRESSLSWLEKLLCYGQVAPYLISRRKKDIRRLLMPYYLKIKEKGWIAKTSSQV